MQINNKEVKIAYPCTWSYKVIGPDRGMVKTAIIAIFSTHEKKYSLRYANASRTGKYHSWSVSLKVQNEAERNNMFRDLKNHPHIKIVI
jgi:putative lipoic acid-binding regulatory protein